MKWKPTGETKNSASVSFQRRRLGLWVGGQNISLLCKWARPTGRGYSWWNNLFYRCAVATQFLVSTTYCTAPGSSNTHWRWTTTPFYDNPHPYPTTMCQGKCCNKCHLWQTRHMYLFFPLRDKFLMLKQKGEQLTVLLCITISWEVVTLCHYWWGQTSMAMSKWKKTIAVPMSCMKVG